MEDNRQYPPTTQPMVEPTHEMHEPYTPPKKRMPWNKLALLFIIMGAIMSIAGWATGGRGGSIAFINGGFHVVTAADRTSSHISFAGENITNIHVNAVDTRIIVESGSNFAVFLTNVDEDTVELSGNTLNINVPSHHRRIHFMNIGFYSVSNEIRIQVPPQQMDSITLTGTSSNVVVEGISVTNLDARSTSGSVRLWDIEAETLNARSTSGSVRGANVHFSTGHLQSTSGSVNFTHISWDSLYAQSTSGSVRFEDARIHLDRIQGGSTSLQSTSSSVNLNISNRRDDFRYDLNSRTGSVRMDGDRFVAHGGSTVINGNGHPIAMRSTSGNVRLNFDS
ncbi:MAG: DUF4097 domain-containing protein [Defluviitaleaceae bacterium]|nr:DUF4097 domain-containing protein [Defluviitaleaceae bacterium]